jgi:peptidyl-tRNA hydrolase, PTH1 family
VALFRLQNNVDYLIVGLGNPGPTYEGTRHNVGYQVVEELARRHGFPKAKRGYDGRCADGVIGRRRVLLLQPTTYMNESGRSVAAALRALDVPLDHVLVAHDHIDLPFGRLRLMEGGGSGGHNGLKSITGLVGADYARLRVGVDRPPSYDPDVVAGYVLSRFGESKAQVAGLVAAAADAVELWLETGLEVAANRVNGLQGRDGEVT